MLTLIPLLNPPRKWGKKKKSKTRRKPARETSATTRSRKKRKKGRKQEVAAMAKRRRKAARRGRGGRFVKGGGAVKRRRSRRRKSSGTRVRRRRSKRRKVTLSVAVNPPKRRRRRRRRSNPALYARRGRGLRKIGSAKRVYVKRRRKTRKGAKGSFRRLNPRRRRRAAAHRRRSNPPRVVGRGIVGTIKNLLSVNTALSGLQIGAGIVIDRAGPALISRYAGRDLESGLTGIGVGLASNVAVSALLTLLKMPNAAAKVLLGGVGSTGARAIQYAIGYAGGRRMISARPASGAAAGLRGLGAVVSPETMVETQALLGDFVQLQGGIPRRDFAGVRGLGDYVEFASQAAGNNAVAAELAPQGVFSPGSDEKF